MAAMATSKTGIEHVAFSSHVNAGPDRINLPPFKPSLFIQSVLGCPRLESRPLWNCNQILTNQVAPD